MSNKVLLNLNLDVPNTNVILNVTDDENNLLATKILDIDAITSLNSYFNKVLKMYDTINYIKNMLNLSESEINKFIKYDENHNNYYFVAEIPFVIPEHLPILIDDLKNDNIDVRIQNSSIILISNTIEILSSHIKDIFLPIIDTYIINM